MVQRVHQAHLVLQVNREKGGKAVPLELREAGAHRDQQEAKGRGEVLVHPGRQVKLVHQDLVDHQDPLVHLESPEKEAAVDHQVPLDHEGLQDQLDPLERVAREVSQANQVEVDQMVLQDQLDPQEKPESSVLQGLREKEDQEGQVDPRVNQEREGRPDPQDPQDLLALQDQPKEGSLVLLVL